MPAQPFSPEQKAYLRRLIDLAIREPDDLDEIDRDFTKDERQGKVKQALLLSGAPDLVEELWGPLGVGQDADETILIADSYIKFGDRALATMWLDRALVLTLAQPDWLPVSYEVDEGGPPLTKRPTTAKLVNHQKLRQIYEIAGAAFTIGDFEKMEACLASADPDQSFWVSDISWAFNWLVEAGKVDRVRRMVLVIQPFISSFSLRFSGFPRRLAKAFISNGLETEFWALLGRWGNENDISTIEFLGAGIEVALELGFLDCALRMRGRESRGSSELTEEFCQVLIRLGREMDLGSFLVDNMSTFHFPGESYIILLATYARVASVEHHAWIRQMISQIITQPASTEKNLGYAALACAWMNDWDGPVQLSDIRSIPKDLLPRFIEPAIAHVSEPLKKALLELWSKGDGILEELQYERNRCLLGEPHRLEELFAALLKEVREGRRPKTTLSYRLNRFLKEISYDLDDRIEFFMLTAPHLHGELVYEYAVSLADELIQANRMEEVFGLLLNRYADFGRMVFLTHCIKQAIMVFRPQSHQPIP